MSREPIIEGRGAYLGVARGQQDIAGGGLVENAAVPGWHEPDTSAQDRHVRRAMSIRSCGSGPAMMSRWRPLRGTHGDAGKDVRNIGGRDRLHQQRRQLRDAVSFDPSDNGRTEVVKLRCGDYRVRDRPRLNGSLLSDLISGGSPAHGLT